MKKILIILVTTIFFVAIVLSISLSPVKHYFAIVSSMLREQVANVEFSLLPGKDQFGNVLYKGPIYHIFFHSLIVYPDLAQNSKNSSLYKKYMITRDQFKEILPQLYENGFVLIDISSIYGIDNNGMVKRKGVYLPEGKKPLIISIDDLSYYRTQYGSGFANKLVLDSSGNVSSRVTTPEGLEKITRDGDTVPIIDDFVAAHPDFSVNGAKGIIALTGFDGVLGYRTNGLPATSSEAVEAKKVIEKLKNTGWSFASHSYFHSKAFGDGTISLEDLKKDTALWNKEVRPLVGDTDIFVGPSGQIFSDNDPRRKFLISQGFKMFCGVGMDKYLHYFYDYVAMDRADIDGYRISTDPSVLKTYFDPARLDSAIDEKA